MITPSQLSFAASRRPSLPPREATRKPASLRPLKLALALAVALFALFALPSLASAETYRVHAGTTTCPAGTIDEGSGLQHALDDAAGSAGPSTISLGAGTFRSPTDLFVYSPGASANPVQIVGAGSGSTVLAGAADGSTVLYMPDAGVAGSSVSKLSIVLNSSLQTGIVAEQTTIDGVEVKSTDAAAEQLTGVDMYGGMLRNSTISLPDLSRNTGVVVDSHNLYTDSQPSEIDDSAISAQDGVESLAPTTIHRSTISAETGAANLFWSINIDDSLLVGVGARPRGLVASAINPGATPSINAENVTIVRRSAPGTTAADGVVAESTGGDTAEIDIYNSIVHGYDNSLHAKADSTSHSLIVPIAVDADGALHNVGESGIRTDDPGFVDAANGDYHLRWDSPLIDASSLTPSGSASTTDLDSGARVVTFGHPATPVDLGAYEYQHRAPTAAASAPATAAAGQAIAFDGSGSKDPDAGDALTYSWSFDDGTSATGKSVEHAFSAAGTHVARLTVTDPTGLSGTATASVMVPAAATPGGGPATQPAPHGSIFVIGKPKVSGGTLTLRLRCSGPASCAGRISESTLQRRRLHVVASRRFKLAAGTTASLRLAPNASGRRLLAQLRKLSVTLDVRTATAKLSRHVTLRAA